MGLPFPSPVDIREVPDPREQFESQMRRALGQVRSRVLETRAQLHEKQRRMRQRQDEIAARRRNSRH